MGNEVNQQINVKRKIRMIRIRIKIDKKKLYKERSNKNLKGLCSINKTLYWIFLFQSLTLGNAYGSTHVLRTLHSTVKVKNTELDFTVPTGCADLPFLVLQSGSAWGVGGQPLSLVWPLSLNSIFKTVRNFSVKSGVLRRKSPFHIRSNFCSF